MARRTTKKRATGKGTTKKRTTKKRATRRRSKPVSYERGAPEIVNVFEMFSEALMAIAIAKLKLAEREVFSESLTELDYIYAQQEQLTADREKIIARQVAFQSKKAKIRPPTRAELAAASKASQDLDELIASATTARAILSLVGKVLEVAEGATKGLEPFEA